MRALASAWTEDTIAQRCAAQLPWRHHMLLLDKLDATDQRLWYAEEAVANGWSRDVLAFQIASRLHERFGNAISNFAATLPPEGSDLAQHVEKFLLELGQGFAFVGRQVRLTINGDEFFCDLLFYHLKLRRYIVIELKATTFEPGFLGQLGMYLAAVDELLTHPSDSPTLGLLLCRSKNSVVAEYALRGSAMPIGVADWTSALIADVTTALPTELAQTLPRIEDIETELSTDSDTKR